MTNKTKNNKKKTTKDLTKKAPIAKTASTKPLSKTTNKLTKTPKPTIKRITKAKQDKSIVSEIPQKLVRLKHAILLGAFVISLVVALGFLHGYGLRLALALVCVGYVAINSLFHWREGTLKGEVFGEYLIASLLAWVVLVSISK